MRYAKSLITLAVACLLAVPAFSTPWKNGPGYGDRFDQLNLTEEEMNNMTLAELRELRQESNRDRCPMDGGQMNQGPMSGPMGRGYGDAYLLMDYLTEEEIQSMTLAEFNELKQQKMDELRNMTAEEVEALREEKRAEMDNMTIAELKEDMEVCSLLGLGNDIRMGDGGFQGGQFGSDGCGFSRGEGAQQNRCKMAGDGAMNQQGRGDDQMNGPGFGGWW